MAELTLSSVKERVAAILALSLGLWHLLPAQTTSFRALTKETKSYTYSRLYLFRDNGHFAAINLEEGVIDAMWNLARVTRLEHVFPTPEPRDVEHGWKFRPFHVTADGRRIFGIAETADGLGDVVAGNVYQLVELELPAMTLVRAVRLPGRGNNAPRALMSPGGKHILATIWPSSDDVKTGVYMLDRKLLRVKAQIQPSSAGVDIFFRSFDVDDPSTNN